MSIWEKGKRLGRSIMGLFQKAPSDRRKKKEEGEDTAKDRRSRPVHPFYPERRGLRGGQVERRRFTRPIPHR